MNNSGSGRTLFAEPILDTVIPTANAERYYLSLVYACISITGSTYTAKVITMLGQSFANYDNLSGTVGTVLNLPDPEAYGFCNVSLITPAMLLIDNVSSTSCQCSVTGNAMTVIETANAGPCSAPFISPCED